MSSADDIMAAFATIAAALDRHAAWLDYQQSGRRAPDKVLVHESIDTCRYIAAVTRGDMPADPDHAAEQASEVTR